jgi:hypothetical protein
MQRSTSSRVGKASNHNTGGIGTLIPSSISKDWSHANLAAAFANALYSASVLDLATVACFFATPRYEIFS